MGAIAPKALMHRTEAGKLCTKLQLFQFMPMEITQGTSGQGGRGRREMREQGEKRPALGLELQNHLKDVEKREATAELGVCKPPASPGTA